MLWRLRSSPHVARNKGAYEDDTHIHILMELCCGGALWHRIGHAQYTEKEVSEIAGCILSCYLPHHDWRPQQLRVNMWAAEFFHTRHAA